MSKYTTLLRWPIENRLDELGLAHAEQNWPQVYRFLGLNDYPIFDESHRQTLNDKLIRRYYMREIGFETVGLFVWNLRTHMHEIMPYYNDLYLSQLMVTDPMLSKSMTYEESWQSNDKVNGTRNVTDEHKTETSSNGTRNVTDENKTETSNDGTSSSTSQDRNVYQDTPMNGLDTGAIESMDYATNVTFDNGSTSGTTSNAGIQNYTGTTDEVTGETGVQEYTGTTGEVKGETGNHDGTKAHTDKGFDRSQSELLLTYRKTLVNIDLMIVDSCASLFMGLW